MNPEITAAIAEIKTSKRELVLQILAIFIFPIVLILLGFIPIERRVLALVVLVCVLLVVLYTEQWTPSMLGIAKNRNRKYVIPYAIFTGAMIVLITSFGENLTGTEELQKWWTHDHFIYFFFIVSLFQEVAYRGYLIPALGKLFTKPRTVFIGNVALFVFLHAIFPNPMISLPVALVAGVGFTAMYLRYPSLLLIIVSHSILNFFAVLYGFFVIPGITY